MKKLTLPIAIALASTSMVAPGVLAGEATAYGRVLYDLVSDDSVGNDDPYFNRHGFAETTMGVKVKHKTDEITYGAQVEFGVKDGVAATGGNARTRIQEFTITKDGVGTIRFGSGTTVTFVISDVDSSGTWIADPLGATAVAGATANGGDETGDSKGDLGIGVTYFEERIRFDSTKIAGGLTLHGQFGNMGSYEFAGKYNANGIRANAWYVDKGDVADGSVESGYGVLVGYGHSSGFNISGTMTSDEEKGTGSNERDLTAIKLGYTQGKHAVSISAQEQEEDNDADFERQTLSYVFSPTGGVKLWVQYTDQERDDGDSAGSLAIGGMVKI